MGRVDLSLIEDVILLGMQTQDGDMKTVTLQSHAEAPPNALLMWPHVSKLLAS